MPISAEGFCSSNKLLSSMSPPELMLLRPHLEAVELTRHDVLEQAESPPSHVHFMECGVASFLARSGAHRIEAAMLGLEGMAGYRILFGEDATGTDCVVITPASALRMRSDRLLAAARRNRMLEQRLMRYAHCVALQMAHTALANAAARTETRLVRWLLMAHDRCRRDELPFVHESMALMLGVYRPSITMALHELESRGLLTLRRGVVEIRDRPALEALSRPFYGMPEAEYARLMRPAPQIEPPH